jgi:hypothetical protein
MKAKISLSQEAKILLKWEQERKAPKQERKALAPKQKRSDRTYKKFKVASYKRL